MSEITLKGEVGGEINYTQVYGLIQSLGEFEDLTINITSIGGDSEVGRQIYDYLKSLNKPITMRAIDYVYSAAFTIFLAGTKRVAEYRNSEFLMHSPWMMGFFVGGDKEAKELHDMVRAEKQLLIDLYAKELGREAAEIEMLMDKDDIIKADAAIGLNMITEIENDSDKENDNYELFYSGLFDKVAACARVNDNYKNLLTKYNKKMDAKEIKTELESQKSILTKLWNYFKGKIKALSMSSEEGETIEIEGDTLVEGATVTSDTPDGTYTVTVDEKKYTIEIAGKVVTTVTEQEQEPPAEDVEALKKENEALKKENEKLKADIEAANALKADYDANKALIEQLKTVHSKHFNPETNTYDFETVATATKVPVKKTAAEIKAEVEEIKKGYLKQK